MGYFDAQTGTVEPEHEQAHERETTRRPFSSRLADLGDRIARTLPPPRRAPEYTFPVDDEPSYPTEDFQVRQLERASTDELLPRFPVTRQGYDCDSVDTHINELEEELAALERQLDAVRAQVPSRDAIAIEIERVGEQTSAILIAAHDEAQETVRLARTHADTVIADAASYAAALTEEATRKVQELEGQAAVLSTEHERRLSELRSTAGALQSLADAAELQFSPAP